MAKEIVKDDDEYTIWYLVVGKWKDNFIMKDSPKKVYLFYNIYHISDN